MEETTTLPPVLLQLSQILEHKLHLIATGSQDIQHTALLATQYLFNHALQSENAATPHINQLVSALDPTEAPQTRSKTNGKRKRSSSPPPVLKPNFQNTPLTGLFVDGMDQDQIWAQLDIRVQNVCDVLNLVLEEEDSVESGSVGEIDSMDDEDEESLLEKSIAMLEEEGWSDEVESEEGDDNEGSEASGEEQAETIAELRDPSSEEEEEAASRKMTLKLPGKRPKPGGHPELDDRFFSLVDFNAEIEAAEAKSSTRGRLDGSDSEDSGEEEVDYFAPVDESQSGGDSQGEVQELYYNDFFGPSKSQRSFTAPPSSLIRKAGKVRFHDEVRVKKIKAEGRSQPVSMLYGGDDYEYDFGELDDLEDESEQSGDMEFTDMHASEAGAGDDNTSDADSGSAEHGTGQDAIGRFKDDLFAEEEEGTQDDMTAHEKRMASLSKQIAELEAENVAPKEWVLMGEAGSRSRPQNSLLEEDLEFERVTKPVPLITEQTVHALENRIKVRILEGRFDDVVRIRPYEDKPFLPSRLFELKDTKSAQSLAQIYEDEYVAAQTGGVVGEDRDGKLRKEHEEIEKLWESISYKLDALSNAHFTPKQPKAIISTVLNVPVVTLESALPTAKSAKTILAPEEVYGPSSSDPRARSEMAPSERRALHNKKRKAKKKTRDLLEKSVDKFAKMKSPKQQKQVALESVVKIGKGVTVVGKKPLKKRSKKSYEAG